jgi:2-methylcitrate dehydratase
VTKWVAIRTRDQCVFVKEQNSYEGGPTNPMSWERTVEKFHWLAETFADEELRSKLIGAVEQLDTSWFEGSVEEKGSPESGKLRL